MTAAIMQQRLILAGALSFLVVMLLQPNSVVSQETSQISQDADLQLRDTQLPRDARIVAIQIDLVAGSFAGISNLPKNWTFTFSNDGDVKATMIAHANTDASALTESQIRDLGLEVFVSRLGSAGAFDVSGLFTSLGTTTKRVLPVSNFGFELEERFLRRQLPTNR